MGLGQKQPNSSMVDDEVFRHTGRCRGGQEDGAADDSSSRVIEFGTIAGLSGAARN